MRHDWVFDVLSDLLTYATQNGLPRLAEKVSETMAVARQELDMQEPGPDEPPPAPPTKDRPMH